MRKMRGVAKVPKLSPRAVSILDLHEVPFFKILGFCSYDQVSKLRPVCKKFDDMCGKHLNHGYQMACAKNSLMLKEFESLLPKRQRERYNHQLRKHCNILSNISWFNTCLGKRIQLSINLNLCCFYPGKIIDEMMYLMRIVSTKKPLPRPRSTSLIAEISDEFNDLKSLVEWHFEKNISPKLKKVQELQKSLEASKIDRANKKKD